MRRAVLLISQMILMILAVNTPAFTEEARVEDNLYELEKRISVAPSRGESEQKSVTTSNSASPYQHKTVRACVDVPNEIRSAVSSCKKADECAAQGLLATTEQTYVPNGQVATDVRGTDRIVDSRTYCDGPDGASVDDLVRVEFYRYKPEIPAPSVQPDGVTLVNIPVVFYSSVGGPRDLPLTLLGHPVVLRVTPVNYHWDFGDKEFKNTSYPGEAVDLDSAEDWDEVERWADISHRYMTKGVVEATLNVRFKGEYSVDGGPFKTIAGTVNNTSPAVPLQLKEARAELVDPNQPMSR